MITDHSLLKTLTLTDNSTLEFYREYLNDNQSPRESLHQLTQFIAAESGILQTQLFGLNVNESRFDYIELRTALDNPPAPIDATAELQKLLTQGSLNLQAITSETVQHCLNAFCTHSHLFSNLKNTAHNGVLIRLQNQQKIIGFLLLELSSSENIKCLSTERLKLIFELINLRFTQLHLQTNEHYFKQLYQQQQASLDGTNYSIITADVEGYITGFNRGASEMLGYTKAEMLGKTPAIFHDSTEVTQRAADLTMELGELIEPGFEAFVAKTRRGVTDEQEWHYIHKDGHRIPVLLSVSALRDANNEITGFMGIAIDITDRVLTTREIREKEATYRLLYEASADGIFLVHDNIIVDCNPATTHLFDCNRDQIIGQSPFRFFPAQQANGEDSKTRAQKRIFAALNGARQVFEWRHIKYDGTPFDTEVSLNTFMVDDKVLLMAIIRDISERKEAEAQLDKSRQSLIEKNRNLTLINSLSSKLQQLSTKEQQYQATIEQINDFIPAAKVAIFEMDDSGEFLKLTTSFGFPELIEKQLGQLDINNSLCGQALQQRRIITCDDLSTASPATDGIEKVLQESEVLAATIVPLYFANEELGVMAITFSDNRGSQNYEEELFETIGKTLSLSLNNLHNIAALQHIAQHDSLTSLGNRSLFHQRFEKTVIQSQLQQATVILFDLDRFKEINDTLGHHIGDKLLQQIGPRIKSQLKGLDYLLCRLGGDEFTLLIQTPLEPEQRQDLLDQLHHSLRQPFNIGQMHLEIDSSFGASIYPDNGADSHALLRCADVAMYHAKNNHLGVSLYQKDFDTNSPERLMLLADLNHAIKDNQLVLFFQPKLNLKTQQVIGFEALVRWQHPSRGLLFPDSFMPLAEVSDVIYPFTDHIIELAMQQQQAWRTEGKNYSVSVNISARNLMDERLYPHIRDCLEKYQTPPELFELELTETALMQDPERAITILQKIATLNIKLSVDDFGTGYSSLAYLRRLPLNALKIDRIFVKDMLENDQDEIIVHSTIALAHNLKLEVIAEGVENLEIIERLQSIDCDAVQGYYLSKPTAWPDMQKWLQANNY